MLKHYGAAICGEGDFDCSVSREDLDASASLIIDAAGSWSSLGATVICSHQTDVQMLSLFLKDSYPKIEEIDLAWSLSHRGIRFGSAERLAELAVINAEGVRVLTDAAQAAVLLALYGIRNMRLTLSEMKAADRLLVEGQLDQNRIGVQAAMDVVAPRSLARRWSRVIAVDDRDLGVRRARVPYEAGLSHPLHLASRLYSRLRPSCDVGSMLANGRRGSGSSEEDMELDLERIGKSHQVVRTGGHA
jgi:hypothetical protein